MSSDHFSSVTPLECIETIDTQTAPHSSESETNLSLNGTEVSSQDKSPVSKYLKLPAGATPSIPKKLPRARLLTS